jgi:hypothetical protein
MQELVSDCAVWYYYNEISFAIIHLYVQEMIMTNEVLNFKLVYNLGRDPWKPDSR